MKNIIINHRFNDASYSGGFVENIRYEREYDETTKLGDIVSYKHGRYFGTLNIHEYYDISLIGEMHKTEIPYLVVDNEVKWNLKASEVKVMDILNTHGLTNVMNVESYNFECGGDSPPTAFIELKEFWDAFKPYFVAIYKNKSEIVWTVTEMKKIYNYFINRNIKPTIPLEFVLSRESWSINELSRLMNLEKDSTKHLLKLCDFTWNNSSKQYENFDREATKNKIKNINIIKDSKPNIKTK